MAENLLVGALTNGQYKKTTASTEATKTETTNSTSKTASKNKGTEYNQEMFLKLLTAEMQYQDPLEPTDNSQYITQLASFTQIETLQTVQSSMESLQANSMVGKVVSLTVDGETIEGKVDFIKKGDDGAMKVSVNGNLYDMSKVDSVVDEEYYSARYMASLLTDAINQLPKAEEVTLKDEEKVGLAISYYNAMDAYSLSFVGKEALEKYNAVVSQFNKLKAAKEAADKEREEAIKKAAEEAAKAAEAAANQSSTTAETSSTSSQTSEETNTTTDTTTQAEENAASAIVAETTTTEGTTQSEETTGTSPIEEVVSGEEA
ncbi:flagellar basal-body rod modification protein FlgD [Pseudobutyrivibrio ruminis]|uniref:Basal-body rod modification protein FlgD n=1 Tax=Pseudobutyrivibrio ruminis TaxID=46206 RepID=A0A1H7ICV4_9FIRM|nr:flagellar hook capping FlgD N-terminal domain-containing protein [Pseudobutyrivibrio ruminis]SEK59682.1 flagellar basal-body rod modification protein FlgD [Pseudobutyrivibrio ruminis]